MDDRNRVLEKIEEVDRKHKATQEQYEELVEELNDLEEDLVDSDDSDEETGLAKYVRERGEEKGIVLGDPMDESDGTTAEQNNNSSLLEKIGNSVDYDIETLTTIIRETHGNIKEACIDLHEELKVLKEEVSSVSEEWNNSDLPPSNSETSNSEANRSLIDDFADTSGEPGDFSDD